MHLKIVVEGEFQRFAAREISEEDEGIYGVGTVVDMSYQQARSLLIRLWSMLPPEERPVPGEPHEA